MGVRQSEEILSVGIHDTQYIDEVQQYFEKYLSTPKKNPRIKDGGCPFLSIRKTGQKPPGPFLSSEYPKFYTLYRVLLCNTRDTFLLRIFHTKT